MNGLRKNKREKHKGWKRMNEKEAIKFLQSRVDLIKNDYPANQK